MRPGVVAEGEPDSQFMLCTPKRYISCSLLYCTKRFTRRSCCSISIAGICPE